MRRVFGCRVSAVLVVTVFSVLLPIGPVADAAAAVSVPTSVREELAATGKATFWVDLRDRADLSTASRVRGWAARGQAVVDALRSTADRSQTRLLAELRRHGATAEPFWAANTVLVTGDAAALEAVAALPEVAAVRAPRTYPVPRPMAGSDRASVDAVEWGIAAIGADDVWSSLGVRGEGIVVANIDTGVDFRHAAVDDQYRGNLGGGTFDHDHNWFDPSRVCPSPAPCDNNSHGTHTMGTMVGADGANQIGVAPGARWIAAKGCEESFCSDEALLASGQWVLAPTDLAGNDPRPDLRPNVVNNSWGSSDGGDTWYRDTVRAWVAAGIFPSFSNGNSGPSCGTVGSPGSYAESYGVGAFDPAGRIAGFSSRGPSPVDGGIKPDIAAPGVDVRSSVPGGYDSYNGTSMAAPHLSGTVALMWSAAPALLGDVAGTRDLLDDTAVDTPADQCGGTPADNGVWGEGRLDALAAVTQSPRGPTGTLRGVVTDGSTGAPMAGVHVDVVGDEVDRAMVTGADGRFQLTLPVGAYAITAGAFGYATRTVNATVAEGGTTVARLRLAPLPSHAVAGRMVDNLRQPVAGAVVTLLDTPLAPQTTTGNGSFSFPSVPEGRYRLSLQPGGCHEPRTLTVTVDGDETLRVLTESVVDAFGYSCRQVTPGWVDATNVLSLSGDDTTRRVTLPFSVRFYGQAYTSVVVGTNGLLNFKNEANPYTNTDIPDGGAPNAAVYALWDDLVIDSQASVRTRTVGTAPNRQFVVEWRNAAFFLDPSKRVSFEVLLGEDGSITTQWAGVGTDDRERGGSATVGIEDAAGTVALQFSFDQPVLSDGRAVRFAPPAG